MKNQTCNKCNIEQPLDKFEKKPKSKTQYQGTDRISTCRSCKQIARNKCISRSPESYMRNLLIQNKSGRVKQGYEYTITIQDLLDIFETQNGKCAMTGIEMTHLKGNGHIETNISIDRINNDIGYIPGNIQLVCYSANMMRRKMKDQSFKNFCKKIATTENAKKSKELLKGTVWGEMLDQKWQAVYQANDVLKHAGMKPVVTVDLTEEKKGYIKDNTCLTQKILLKSK